MPRSTDFQFLASFLSISSWFFPSFWFSVRLSPAGYFKKAWLRTRESCLLHASRDTGCVIHVCTKQWQHRCKQLHLRCENYVTFITTTLFCVTYVTLKYCFICNNWFFAHTLYSHLCFELSQCCYICNKKWLRWAGYILHTWLLHVWQRHCCVTYVTLKYCFICNNRFLSHTLCSHYVTNSLYAVIYVTKKT